MHVVQSTVVGKLRSDSADHVKADGAGGDNSRAETTTNRASINVKFRRPIGG